MAPSVEERVAAMHERLSFVERDVKAMEADVREIRDTIITVRGGWKLLTLVVAISASLGALLAKFIPWAGTLPR